MDDALVDRLRALTTSVVNDARDRLTIAGQCHGLRAVTVERQFAPVSPNSRFPVCCSTNR